MVARLVALLAFLVLAFPATAEIYKQGSPDARCVALTFDDGPDPTLTPQLLAILAAEDVRATFFLVGRSVEAHPEIARAIASTGHELGNHSWSHAVLPRLSRSEIRDELEQTDMAIAAATGIFPAVVRPPFGAVDGGVVEAAERPVILWTFATFDWLGPSARFIERRVGRLARPGAIILMHDVQSVAIEAIGAVIDELRASGFGFLTVSEMLAGSGC